MCGLSPSTTISSIFIQCFGIITLLQVHSLSIISRTRQTFSSFIIQNIYQNQCSNFLHVVHEGHIQLKYYYLSGFVHLQKFKKARVYQGCFTVFSRAFPELLKHRMKIITFTMNCLKHLIENVRPSQQNVSFPITLHSKGWVGRIKKKSKNNFKVIQFLQIENFFIFTEIAKNMGRLCFL